MKINRRQVNTVVVLGYVEEEEKQNQIKEIKNMNNHHLLLTNKQTKLKCTRSYTKLENAKGTHNDIQMQR